MARIIFSRTGGKSRRVLGGLWNRDRVPKHLDGVLPGRTVCANKQGLLAFLCDKLEHARELHFLLFIVDGHFIVALKVKPCDYDLLALEADSAYQRAVFPDDLSRTVNQYRVENPLNQYHVSSRLAVAAVFESRHAVVVRDGVPAQTGIRAACDDKLKVKTGRALAVGEDYGEANPANRKADSSSIVRGECFIMVLLLEVALG